MTSSVVTMDPTWAMYYGQMSHRRYELFDEDEVTNRWV